MSELLIAITLWCSPPTATGGYNGYRPSSVQACQKRLLECAYGKQDRVVKQCFQDELERADR